MMAINNDKPVRSSGVLLHPTSLPGPYGIGDLGGYAYRWIDALFKARQRWWQILPLTPTGFGDSPYQSFSAFAGNPYLVSPDVLIEEGLLRKSELPNDSFDANRVDFDRVDKHKQTILQLAWKNFKTVAPQQLTAPFQEFEKHHEHWLDDYALFRAVRESRGDAGWFDWPKELIARQASTLEGARRELHDRIGFHKFCQFLFWRQWGAVRNYARDNGVYIIGDAPIFVAGDSADVWANQSLFKLDENGKPRVVAGVPPDYFSATGQLWGNPLYDWRQLRATGFRWWIDRLRTTLEQVDMIRLDHFRGFEAYWEIPANMLTAEHGKWVKAPGAELFSAMLAELGGLPLIAEDLGLITEEVNDLRDQFALPGMRVLQFAFGGGNDNPYLPHNHTQNTVVYTGTHDNNTTRGWYAAAPEAEKHHVRRYLAIDGANVAWDFLRTAWASVADYAIAPLQDVLNLNAHARMNRPGETRGNWGWRCQETMLTPDILGRLADLTELYQREANPAEPQQGDP